MERIFFGEMPDCYSDSASWLEHPQHLTHTFDGRRKKHHAKTADHGIEGIFRKGEVPRQRYIKIEILKPPPVRLAKSGFHHFGSCIHADNVALRSDALGKA